VRVKPKTIGIAAATHNS